MIDDIEEEKGRTSKEFELTYGGRGMRDEKAEAEAQSNIGKAVRLENGRWVPAMDEEVDWTSNSDAREVLASL